MTTLRKFITRWGFDVDFGPLEKMEAEQKKLRSNFVKIGAVATAALAAVVVPAGNLEAAIRNAMTMTGLTGDEFERVMAQMSNQAMEMSDRLGTSGVEIGESFYQVLSTGAKALSPQFNALSETGIKLAKVAGISVSDAVESLNGVIKAFGKDTSQANVFASKLFKSTALASTDLPKLIEAMKNAAPAARSFGVEIEETSAVLLALAEGNFKGGQAGNAFRRIMLRMIKPTAEVKKGMKALGVTTVDASTGKFLPLIDIFRQMKAGAAKMSQATRAAAIAQISGVFAYSQLNTILNTNLDTVENWAGTIRNSGDALDVAYGQLKGFNFQAKRMWTTIKNLAAQLGGPLLGPLTAVIEKVSDTIASVREFIAESPGLNKFISLVGGGAVAVIAAGAGLGIMLASLRLAVIAVKKLGWELLVTQVKAMALPILITAAALALFFLLDDLASFFTGNRSVMGRMIEQWKDFKETIIVAGIAMGAIGLYAMAAFMPIMTLIVLLAVLAALWVRNKDKYAEWWDLMKRTDWSDIIDEFTGWIGELWNAVGVSEKLKDIWRWWSDIATKERWRRPERLERRARTVERRRELQEAIVQTAPVVEELTMPAEAPSVIVPPLTAEVPLPGAAAAIPVTPGSPTTIPPATQTTNHYNNQFNIEGTQDPEAVGEAVERHMRDIISDTGEAIEEGG